MEPSVDMTDAASAAFPGARITAVVPMVGGSSAHVVALDLQWSTVDSRRVLFRQHTDRSLKGHGPDIASKEFRLLKRLHRDGLEVPRPLALHRGRTLAGPWLVLEWIDGEVAHAGADADSTLDSMAEFLARLHLTSLESLTGLGLTPIEDPTSVLSSYLTNDDVGSAVSAAVDAGIERRPNPDVLLHGDYWPGNVMFRDGELVAVLDWEDATMGDPLVDLACARVEVSCAFGMTAAERFTTAYLEQVEVSGRSLDLFDLAIWEVYVSASALSGMHLWGLTPDEEQSRRNETQAFYRRAAARLTGNADKR